MFEKEAEERYKEHLADPNYYESSEEESYLHGFQEGAEFGYNKALEEQGDKIESAYREGVAFGKDKLKDEWHKQDIDDIYDCIAEDWSVRYFICIMKDKRRVTAMGNCDEACNGEVSVNLFFDHDDAKYYMDDIVWWKEIVPPKEASE